MSSIAISSGHGLHVSGAMGLIDEVAEARRVADRVTEILQAAGVTVSLFHDNTSRNQRDNIAAILAHHNTAHPCPTPQASVDVSIHFNAIDGIREAGIGVETLYRDGNNEMHTLASHISKAIAHNSGLILRRVDGTWARDDLQFLTHMSTNRAVMIEVCFVNSREDVRLYQLHFEAICMGIADVLQRWVGANNSNIGSPETNNSDNKKTNLPTSAKWFVDTSDGWHRVQSMPFARHADADAVRQLVLDMDLDVKPDVIARGGMFVVQAGAFRDAGNAEALVGRLGGG